MTFSLANSPKVSKENILLFLQDQYSQLNAPKSSAPEYALCNLQYALSSAIIIIVVISHHATGPQQHFHNPLRHPCSYCGADGRRRVRRPLGDPSKLQAPHGHN